GDRRLPCVNAALIYGLSSLFPAVPGTIVKMRGGQLHVQESPKRIQQLIDHAKRHGSARLADLRSHAEEEVFATSNLPSPSWVRNSVWSRPEDLTLNGVDLRYLIDQYARVQADIRADALGE